MQTPWFLWKGEHSRERGIMVEEYPPVVRAGERVRRINLPGRSGSLALVAEPAFDDFPLTMRISLTPGTRPADVSGWLSGKGLLVLGCEADRALDARLSAPLRFTVLPGGWHGCDLRFDCHPFKRQFPGEADCTVSPAQLADSEWQGLRNPGDVPARPRYTILGSGCMTLTWHLPDREELPKLTVDLRGTPWAESGGAVFDSESMTVTTPDGRVNLSPVSRLDSGEAEDFGLHPGRTRISAEAEDGVIGGLSLTPRWRWR